MAVQGIQSIEGNIVAPLYPSAGNQLFAGLIGRDAGVSGSTPTNATTTTGSVSVGGNTVTLTSATGWSGTVTFQIGTTISGTSEVHTGTVAGSTITLSGSQTFYNAHAGGDYIAQVVGPYTHNLVPTTTLPSFSIEKNMNGLDLQFGGCLINKGDLKLSTTAEPEITYGVIGQQVQIIGSPAAPTWPTDTPFSPTNVSISLGGAIDASAVDGTLTIDNGSKAYPTFNSQVYPANVVALTRKTMFKGTVFTQALSGGAGASPPGYFADLATPTSRVLTVTLTQGANVITISLGAVVEITYSNPIKVGDVLMTDFEWTALGTGSDAYDVSATIVNSSYYLPYA